MTVKTIQQKTKFQATPKQVYEVLVDGKKHSKMTGEKATCIKKVGGKFTAYSGYIVGINLELRPGKRIVQAWRSTEWPDGHYSIVIYDLKGAGKNGTELSFTHIGVPTSDYSAKAQGWKDYYWTPMKTYFETLK